MVGTKPVVLSMIIPECYEHWVRLHHQRMAETQALGRLSTYLLGF